MFLKNENNLKLKSFKSFEILVLNVKPKNISVKTTERCKISATMSAIVGNVFGKK